MFRCLYHSQVYKDLKRIDQQVQEYILQNIIPQIASNPYSGIRLHGPLRNFYKCKCSFGGTSYRIIYQIQDTGQVVIIMLVASRAGAYERLLRRLR